jgi:hypothetical protein
MKAQELRIGNYLIRYLEVDGYVEGEFEYVKIEKEISCEFDGPGDIAIDHFPINHYEPIPLTEEWLLKFGFKKTGMVLRIDVTPHLELCHIIGEMRIQTISSEFTNTIPVKYIHQLQNLYFALTGKELEIKEIV